jgi:hypothetical protein
MGDDKKDSTLGHVAQATAEIMKAAPVYTDLVQPAAKQAGQTLELVVRAVNVALLPVRGLVWGAEQIVEYLNDEVPKKLKDTPPERIVAPPLYLAGPVFEGLRYTAQEAELRELYANLLARSMDSATQRNTHPAFAEIIKQLVPLEARLLRELPSKEEWPIANMAVYSEKSEIKEMALGGCIIVAHGLCPIATVLGLVSLTDVSVNIDNLVRLRLVEVPPGQFLMDESEYEAVTSHAEWGRLAERCLSKYPGGKVEMQPGILRLTAFGKEFISVCMSDDYTVEAGQVTADAPYQM